MRLNRLGAKLIAVFGLVGLAMLGGGILLAGDGGVATLGAVVLIGMGAAYVLGAVVAILVAIRARMSARHNRWLAEHGLRGTAKIVSATTDMSVNLQPLFELVVDLDVPGRPARRVERTLVVGAFAARRLRPGLSLPAYVHPRDPDDVLLVW